MNAKSKLKLIFAGILLFGLIFFSISSIFILPPKPTNNLQSANNSQTETEKIILFYGEGCPHCKKVEEYLKTNPPLFAFEQKEVYYNENNQKELAVVAGICKFNQNEVGVPFLWIPKNQKCIVGDEPIINYFKEIKSNEKNQ